MKVTHLPENGTNFIPYEVLKNNIDFNDGDLMFNVSKKERDYEVVIDICQDYRRPGDGNRRRAEIRCPGGYPAERVHRDRKRESCLPGRHRRRN